MKKFKRQMLSLFMVLFIVCATVMIPAATSKAAVCPHLHTYEIPRYKVATNSFTHTLTNGESCTYYIDKYIVSVYCNDCGAYLYDMQDYSSAYGHTNPDCPSHY